MSQENEPGKGPPSVDQDQSGLSNIFVRLLPYLIILAAVLLFFYKLAFSNLILARGDTFLYFYPYWHAAAQALKSTHLPLWNESLFMGAPFLANSQAGIFYPLNWPLWLTLSTPVAVKSSIVLHLLFAAWGTYLAGRQCLNLTRAASVLAAILFALGGYLTAQVEHINQLQGLAWLPWYFVAACRWRASGEEMRSTAKFIAIVAILIALQLLAGHTQTVFISLFGLLIWIVTTSFKDGRWQLRRSVVGVLVLLAAALLALLIAGVQVAPTAELLMHSSRQGGFTPREALSFSLHPLILTRSLLPQYSGSLFSEYAAFLPISALLLAVAGAWSWRSDHKIRALFFVSLVGFLFALGMFNPIYQLLVRLPGFDLFRVPARWLALYAFGVALLAGAGIEALLKPEEDRGKVKAFVVGLLLIVALFGWSLLSTYLSSYIDVGSEITAEAPSSWTWVFWVAELAVAAVIIFIVPETRGKAAFAAILVMILVVQFAFSRTLSYNNPTTPEAFSDYRPPSARLAANSQCASDDSPCMFPQGRILSLSDIFFDPGDQAEIDSAYSEFLSETALYDYTIAIKQKEIIAPDLPMIYGIQSVDGFDGGLLPLTDYTELMSLILPEGSTAVDGRLREYLSEIPEARWMDLFNTRYLITDKVGDEWQDGVFFDKQHQVTLDSDSPTIGVGYIPDFMSTELWFIADDSQGLVEAIFEDGRQERLDPERIGDDLYRARWSEPAALSSLNFLACASAHDDPQECSESWTISGATLVDGEEDVFMPVTLGEYQLIHSGDVKIYENLDVLPRAFLVSEWIEAEDVMSSIEFMASPDFDPQKSAVVIGLGSGMTDNIYPGTVEVLDYEAERVILSVESEMGGLLVLTDAYYPGWHATVDGQSAEIYQADGYFRSLWVPAGSHDIEFHYEPASLPAGLIMTTLGIFGLVVLLVIGFRKRTGTTNGDGTVEISS